MLKSSQIIGDISNVIFLIVNVIYFCLVSGHLKGWISLDGLFGENWTNDGFCLSFKDGWAHSHLLCLYGDLILGAALYFYAGKAAKTRPELSLIRDGAASVVMHGMAHGLLYYYDDLINTLPPRTPIADAFDISANVVFLVVLFAFWYSFLGMAFPVVTSHAFMIGQCVMHSLMVVFVIPRLLLFGYVNGVIFFNLALIGLIDGFHGPKDEYYAIASLSNMPILAAAWAEPLFCDSFLINWGGHIIFDYTIPISQIVSVAIMMTILEPRPKLAEIAKVKRV